MEMRDLSDIDGDQAMMISYRSVAMDIPHTIEVV